MKCARCDAELEQDPFHAHWKHCPSCAPEWVRANRRMKRLLALDTLAATYAADKRGRPRIGGVQQ